MIDVEKRKSIWVLSRQGHGKKRIAKLLGLDPKSVRRILQTPEDAPLSRAPCEGSQLDPSLVEKVYRDCQGFAQRTWEILTEEHGLKIAYSTLTEKIRDLGLSDVGQEKGRFTDGEPLTHPGKETQHDTSPYVLPLGGKPTRLECSELYFRFSKMRYTQFYPVFDRFRMKCFFHEAHLHFRYSAPTCVIDNTHLAVLKGTGKGAVFVPEMIAFAKSLGFEWLAHERGHSNRKAGKERGFRTINENFLPGRRFSSLEDLNRQALSWSTERFAKRPLSKTGLIPIELFEQEKSCLTELPDGLPAPYRDHERFTDRFGYIAFQANYYWIPGIKREWLKVLEFSKALKIYRKHKLILEYPIAPFAVRNQKFKPPSVSQVPYEPRNLKLDSSEEEKRLRALGEIQARYLNWIRSKEGSVSYPNKFIRELYVLSRKVSLEVFTQALTRALEYRIRQIDGIERIAAYLIQVDTHAGNSPGSNDLSFSSDYQGRDTYQQGRLSDEPNLSIYSDLVKLPQKEDEHETGK